MTVEHLAALAIGGVGGAAIGLERQASGHADGPRARFAGIRTFTLLGILGAVAGVFLETTPLAGAALLTGASALVVAAYVAASRHDVDGTTEVAALVVLAAGALCGTGDTTTGSALIAVTGLLLVEKTRLHALAARVDDADLRAGLRFAAMALVILPLLPAGPYGPGIGVRPRELWALVLFFSGLSFAGQIAQRAVGPSRGLVVAGALGGVVSSTNVTLTFARTSQDEPALAAHLGLGALAANLVLFPRVLAATAVMNAPLALQLLPLLAAPFAAGVLSTALLAWRHREQVPARAVASTANPLNVAAALQMAALFQIVLYVVHEVRRSWGETGLVASGAALGLTDVDALTVTMARGVGAGVSLHAAATAVAVGVLANTALKLTIACVVGRGAYRGIAGTGLLAIAAASAVTLYWLGAR